MIDLLALATGLTQAWTSTYSLGLPATVREGRRSEIQSDLWDQQRLASLQRERPRDTAGHILLRALLGMPSDIAWRAETSLAARKERTGAMTESWTSRVGLLVGIAIAFIPIAAGGIHLAAGPTDVEGEPAAAWIIWSAISMLSGAAIAAGLLMVRQNYSRGMTLVAAGVIVFCAITWMAFITVPVGIALLVLAHLLGRGTHTSQSTGAT